MEAEEEIMDVVREYVIREAVGVTGENIVGFILHGY